jgi:hypothetical protein
MEFVDGVNLRQLLLNGRIATREALAIVPQICDALQFAHDQGIVHRDIKPENILLDRRGRVKVADFGLAKIIGHDSAAELPVGQNQTQTQPGNPTNDLTEANKIMGTPQYMSPEQTQRPGEVDHRADIYALGVVFYQMLTGELPGKQIEPPSKKVQIDVRLDEIVLRALEKKPELRFQQASVLKTQVETIAENNRGTTSDRSTPPFNIPPHWLGYEYKSKRTFYNLPLLHIANGIDPQTGTAREARGIVAVGGVATGVLAIGGRAFGGIAFGGIAVGVLAIGGIAVGIVSFGGLVLALAVALGGLAIAPVAIGGLAVGWLAVGGNALGMHVFDAQHHSLNLQQLYRNYQPTLFALMGGFWVSLLALGFGLNVWAKNHSRVTASPIDGAAPEKKPASQPLGTALNKVYETQALPKGRFGRITLVGTYNGKRAINWMGAILTWLLIYGTLFIGLLIIFGRYVPLFVLMSSLVGIVTLVTGALVNVGLKMPMEQLTPLRANNTSVRFSRTAIAGGAWLLLLIACFVLANVNLRTFFLGPLGLLAPLGTTILGWVAITQIRQSAGKLRGLWLAVLDGLLFPLLALDAAIFGLIGLIVKSLGRLPYFAPSGDGSMGGGVAFGYQIAMLFCLWLGTAILISIVADFFIIRSVWRAVNKTAGETEATALSAFEPWLAQMDAGDYARAWETAAPLFRRVVSQAEWTAKCEKVRRPLGKIILRDLQSARFTSGGKCFRAIFTVRFEDGFDAVETVTFMRQPDRSWRAITYIVRLSTERARDWKRAFWIKFFVMSAVVLVLVAIGISVTTAVNFFYEKKPNSNYAVSLGNELALRAKAWQTPHPEPTRVRQLTSAPFVAQLPDGGSVELLAVRLPSSTNQPWWQPDGSPSIYGSNVELENQEQMGTGFFALVRVHFPKTLAQWPRLKDATNPPTTDLGTGVWSAMLDGRRILSDDNHPDTMFGGLPLDQAYSQGNKTTLLLKVATAGWNTLATQKPGWFNKIFSGPARKEWTFSETPTGNLKVTITHLSENPGMEYRLVAVDEDGTEYVPSQTKRTKTSTEISTTFEAEFEPVSGSGATWQLPLSRVREVRWEARPYETVEFRNVSLQPGTRTTVEVKDFGEEIKPAGQTGKPNENPKDKTLNFSFSDNTMVITNQNSAIIYKSPMTVTVTNGLWNIKAKNVLFNPNHSDTNHVPQKNSAEPKTNPVIF